MMNEQPGAQQRKSAAFSRAEPFKRSDPVPEAARMGPPLAWLIFYVIAAIGGFGMQHASGPDIADATPEVTMRW
jgi:hypothetical protein